MDNVAHSGTVTEVSGGYYTIKIVSMSLCAACHAKDACPSSDKKDKYITIAKERCRELNVGETVNVVISLKSGEKAFVIAYTIPIVLIILSVVVLKVFEVNQGVSILVILAILACYFWGLYKLRGKIEKKIKIKVE